MKTATRHVIMFIDVADSVSLRRDYGETKARELITKRLLEVEAALRRVDPEILERRHAEGDSILLFGKLLFDIFRACVEIQNKWKGWVEGPPIRIVIGYGDYDGMNAAPGGEVSGRNIDEVHRIKGLTPQAGVCITQGAYVELPVEFQEKLKLRTETIPGYEDSVVLYEADHAWLPPTNQRQPVNTARERRMSTPLAGPDTRKDAAVVVADALVNVDRFWKVFAVVAAALFVAAVVIALAVYLTKQ